MATPTRITRVDTNDVWPTAGGARWIGPDSPARGEPVVFAAVLRFQLDAAATFNVRVSADERYALFVNGDHVGRGPERGDLEAWRFETYQLALDAGEHVIVARVQALGDLAPFAQVSAGPAFILQADAPFDERLSTGKAAWQIALVRGFGAARRTAGPHFYCAGGVTLIDGRAIPWNSERGEVPELKPATVLGPPASIDPFGVHVGARRLVPASLPAMLDEPRRIGRVRYVSSAIDNPRKATDLSTEHDAWQAFATLGRPVTVAARTRRRVILDLENYYCGYPSLRVSGGRDATIAISIAESLYVIGDQARKDDRNAVLDKDWLAAPDRFTLDGGNDRHYEPLWWQAGRYVAIDVEAASEPVELLGFVLRETRYPIEPCSDFAASDPRLGAIKLIAIRSLQMCMHETYVDCPHYEQLMYVGDTRLQALVTYVTSSDDRLPRKAIEMFDVSRSADGLTRARLPSREPQTIPPFSLWWVLMVRDYAWWRDDANFVRSRLPGVRAVLDRFLANVDAATGLPMPPPGWPFVDWVPGWEAGVPPTARTGPTATISLQLVLALQAAATLERDFGEAELAARFARHADDLQAAVWRAFFDPARALLAEDLGKTRFAEHANALTLIAHRASGSPDANASRAHRELATHLFTAASLDRATIYFSHYLFEACAAVGAFTPLLNRLGLWFDLASQGFMTTPEMPEPTRSDCHGWGAHPLFHYAATICGVRPASAGFARVRIEPLLGTLTEASISIPHPRGTIRFAFQHDVEAKALRATVDLPEGISGTLAWNGKEEPLHPGAQTLNLTAP